MLAEWYGASNGSVKGIDQRIAILNASLQIEAMTSMFLAHLLGIKDLLSSKTFGNKSSAMSFNNKIDLLIEIKALSADTKSKYQLFMEIRNQFVHNVHAVSFVECFRYVGDGKKATVILKMYEQPKELNEEERLEKACAALSLELLKTTGDITGKLEEKDIEEFNSTRAKESHEAFKKAVKFMEVKVNEFINEKIKNKQHIDSNELNNFGTDVAKIIRDQWIKEMGFQ